MENLNHTPGPWEISDDNSWECAVLTSKETHIIEVKNNDMSETGFDEMYANAKLIAAAPDLLKACISALKDVQEINKMLIANGHHGYVLMETELDEVIKKATT